MGKVTKEQVYDAIRTVIDPEVGFNLVDMGLIYDAIIDDENNVKVVMTLSTRGCPLHQMLTQWVKDAVERIPEVKSCEVEVVWDPPWNISMASENVKKALGAGGNDENSEKGWNNIF
ncbi:metal-sulfur cluster assembly factor [Nitrosophilus alvini]|uniref:metal-sulfur cluster assembly factor n=1 Tax=Nitrosophilus alvini TaxID=2714855 RepID=UPI00190E2B34|nr:metal-sulfur cluster assembly factor [Nitrosophilus alvini]